MDRRITDNMLGGNVDERLFRRGDIVDEKIIQSMVGTFEEIDSLDDDGLIQNEDSYSQTFIGDKRLFHTFYRETRTEPYRYAGLCERDMRDNLHPAAGKKVFIISQFHSEKAEEIVFNHRFAKALAKMIVRRGDVPIVPHLYFPSFMTDYGWERDFGIEAGHLIMELCDHVVLAVIDGRFSDGMRLDLDHATEKLALMPERMEFSKKSAMKFIEQELSAYEKRSGSEYR